MSDPSDHVPLHAFEDAKACPKCDAVFQNRAERRSHLIIEHGGVDHGY